MVVEGNRGVVVGEDGGGGGGAGKGVEEWVEGKMMEEGLLGR